jgi:hypothetical protein
MRKAYNDYSLIVDGDKFIGVSLGYDFTSEHEWGIDDMKRLFGMPEPSKKNMGVKNRTITICPKSLVFKEEKKGAVLWTAYHSWDDKIREDLPTDLKNYIKDIEWQIKYEKEHPSSDRKAKDPMISAWDGGTFGVAVVGTKEVGYLKELYEAFQQKNVVIARLNIGGANPFSNASLSLLIADRLPQYALDGFYSADKEYYDREDYEEKIGMKKIIRKHKGGYHEDKYFMACSPKWIDYRDAVNREKRKAEMKTKYDIQYWINYSDDDNNYGWYTVEEIKKWLTTPKLHLVDIRKG